MAERPSITPDRRDEPAEVECGGVDAGAAAAARDEDHVTRPDLGYRFGRIVPERTLLRLDDTETAVRQTRGSDCETAVVQPQNGGHGDGLQPVRRLVAAQPRLETEPPCHADDVVGSALPLSKPAVVRKLGGVGGNTEMTRDEGESAEPGIAAAACGYHTIGLRNFGLRYPVGCCLPGV